MKKRVLIFGLAIVMLLAACKKTEKPAATESAATEAEIKPSKETTAAETEKASEKAEAESESKEAATAGAAGAESVWSEDEIHDAVAFLNKEGVNGLLYSRFKDLSDEEYLSLYDIVYQMTDDSVDLQALLKLLEADPGYSSEMGTTYASWDTLNTLLTDVTGYGLDSDVWDEDSVGYEKNLNVFYTQHGDTNHMLIDAVTIAARDQLMLLCTPGEYSFDHTRFIVTMEKTDDPETFLIKSIESCGKNAGGKEPEDGSYFTFTTDVDYNKASEKGYLTLYDKSGEKIWSYETEECLLTELEVISDIGLRDNGYYFAAGGKIYCIDRTEKGNGRVLWSTEDVCGASQSFAFAPDDSLHLCGYYGPVLAVIDKNGNMRHYLEDLSFRDGTDPSDFYWPYELSIAGDGTDYILFESNDSSVKVNIEDGTVLDWFIFEQPVQRASTMNSQSTDIPVSAEWSDREPASGDIIFIADDDEYSHSAVIRVSSPVTDLNILRLELSDVDENGEAIFDYYDIAYFVKLDSSDTFVLRMTIPGDTPYYGLSFIDKSGDYRIFAIGESGEDGSLYLMELYPAQSD